MGTESNGLRRVEVIAEVGSTHDGSVYQAVRMVELWASLGADTVKFQDHRWQDVYGPHPNPRVTEPRWAYYERTTFNPVEWHKLIRACHDNGVRCMVSPFSVEAAEEHRDDIDAFKVASGEVNNQPLLEALRDSGKPVYLSSGMSSAVEVQAAAKLLGDSLHCAMLCTSEYPCKPQNVGLDYLYDTPFSLLFQARTRPAKGLSDHTMGMAATLGAIALGATVIERHVTPSRELYGSDAAHSLEPDEFKRLVQEIRDLEQMLNPGFSKDALVDTPAIREMRRTFMGERA